jgi:hypothetical protein
MSVLRGTEVPPQLGQKNAKNRDWWRNLTADNLESL